MLIKKVDSSWYPSEKKDLQVGQTIEFDNPRDLIINGQAVGIVDGIERTPYELYGVWTNVDEEGYKEYLSWKHLQTLKEKEKELAAQNTELKEKVIETATTTAAVEAPSEKKKKK